MSANNWTTCPRCLGRARRRRKEDQIEADRGYGKMPVNVYLELVEKIKNPIAKKQTLAEYYVVNIDKDGIFTVEYSGKCDKCEFNHYFSHKKTLIL